MANNAESVGNLTNKLKTDSEINNKSLLLNFIWVLLQYILKY